MRPPRWMAEGTEPTDAEVAGLSGEDPVWRGVADATEPTEAEVRALLATVPAPRPWRPSPAWVLVPLAVGVALWLGGPAPPSAPPPAPVVAVVADWSATGAGTWTEVAADEGTRVHQTSGVVRYEVGPRDLGAGFVVQARDVEVAVIGTVFDVGIEGDAVWVEVLEGLVEVRHAGRSVLLEPDSTWTTAPPPPPAPKAPPTPAPPPPADDGVEVLGELLGRLEAGERSPELHVALVAWAEAHEGPLVEGARAAAVEVGAAVLPPVDAVAALDAFLKEHPDTPRRLILLELRADLVRDRLRDCAGALPYYRTVAAQASGARQARAEAWWGLCAASLGGSDAAEALRRALDHGVAPPLRDEVIRALAALELPHE